jgi:hypothetical protein
LNHLICEHLPKRGDDGRRITNSDPITGQAAWFDVRVRLTKCEQGEHGTAPYVTPLADAAGAARPTVIRWPQ